MAYEVEPFQTAGPPASPRIFQKDDNGEFIREAFTRFQGAESASSRWRSEIQQYYDAYGNEIWPDGVREQMEAEGRPSVNPNYATHMVNTVLGQDIAERQEIRFKPVDLSESDGVMADWLTRLVRYFYEKCGGHRHETQARFDQLITGLGWSEIYVDVTQIPFTVKMAHVPAYEMYWDPGAKDTGLQDAEYLFRKRAWDRERVLAKWPDAKHVLPELLGSTRAVAANLTRYREVVPLGTYGKAREAQDTVTVLEYQYKKPETWVAYVTDPEVDEATGEVISEGGEEVTVPLSEFHKRFSAAEGSEKPPRPQEWVKFPKDVYYRCYLLDTHNDELAMLEKPKPIRQNQYTYKAITGLRHVNVNKEQVEWFGLMKLIYEVQLLAAKVFSSTVEMLIRSNKGGGFIEEDALLDWRRFQDERSVPGVWHVVQSGAVAQGKILETRPPSFPPFHGELLGMTQGLIQQMTGISSYLQGTADSERSNVYVSNLQSRSLIALGPLSDPYNAFRLEVGRAMSESIRLYISDRLIDKVINDEGIEGITAQTFVDETGQEQTQIIATPAQLLRSRSLSDFDVAVDTGSASPTEKQAVWNTWGQIGPDLARHMPQIYQEMLPGMVKYLPLPTEATAEMSRKIETQIEEQKQLQTMQGIAQWASQQPIEELEMLLEHLGGVYSQYQQQQQGQQPQQAQPAQ